MMVEARSWEVCGADKICLRKGISPSADNATSCDRTHSFHRDNGFKLGGWNLQTISRRTFGERKRCQVRITPFDFD